MNFKNTAASAALIISGLVSLSSAQAATVTWDLGSPSGLLGNTQTYTAGGATISAAGFAGSFSSPTALFGKALGGDESGLGLNNDPLGTSGIALVAFHHGGPLVRRHGARAGVGEQIHQDIASGEEKQIVVRGTQQMLALFARGPADGLNALDTKWLNDGLDGHVFSAGRDRNA